VDASFLCWFLCGLAVVAVVGHVLWLAFAAVLEIFFGAPQRGPRQQNVSARTRCVLCGSWLHPDDRRCLSCDLDPECAEAAELRGLNATSRHLARLARTHLLDGAAGATIRASIDRLRRELIDHLEKQVGLTVSRRPAADRDRQPAPDPLKGGGKDEPLRSKTDAEVGQTPELQPIPTVLPASNPAPAAPRPRPQSISNQGPPLPRRTFGEMLAGFMEERNILWGELVGGLLIVGCSIALVISLRKTLEALPYFPFLIIAAVTTALIGAGRYTLSHWKLESTSRGLLVIGTMLVPLCFMVLAGWSVERNGDWLELTMEAGALGLFTWLVSGAARILLRPALGAAPGSDWLATAAILGASASQLLVPHIEEARPGSGLVGLVGYVPAIFFSVAQGLALTGVWRRVRVSSRAAGGLFLSLALGLYSVLIAFTFVLYQTENFSQALEYLAVPVALAGLPLLLGGTIANAKLALSETPTDESELGGLPLGVAAVIATIMALAGTLVLLLALVAAWPHPIRLTAIGLVNAAVLALVAHRFRLTAAYVPAQICLAVASLTGFHLLAGHLAVQRQHLGWHLWNLWWSAPSGVVMLGLAGALAGAAEWLARKQRPADSLYQAVGAGVFAIVSLIVVATDAFQTPGRMALVYGIIAAGAWAANLRWRQVWLTRAAAAVLFGAATFGLRWYGLGENESQALVWSALLHSTVVLALAIAFERWPYFPHPSIWLPGETLMWVSLHVMGAVK
jgi:hypothetical protein